MLKRALETCGLSEAEGLSGDEGLRYQKTSQKMKNPETSTCMDVNDEDRTLNESNTDDPVLQSNHKIFLSHSGAQKDFVEQLCADLERRYLFPFFDKRPSSLPKGERFPDLILKAAQQCEMAVVVVSEEYFTSKWPMIELHAFVQARLKSNTNLKILPLFYGLSVGEFGNESRRGQWFKKWEDWAKIDSRINIDEWKHSLKVMASFNGIEYKYPNIPTVEAYREDVVANICREVVADIKWDDSHVQGRSKLCQAIYTRIQQIQASQKPKVCLVGFYGVGGVGKTTISKSLCNELYGEFEGKVSHIEFGSGSFEELIKKVLKELTNTSQELLQQLSGGQCQFVFREKMSKQRVFLTIDNVWDDSKSIGQAKMYLQAHFHEGSVVMVTSRSLKTLTYLGISQSHCFEMPELEYESAKNLFLYHAAYGTQFLNSDDQCAIEECVALCYFRKGDSEWPYLYHYLPLALKALGVQMGCVGNEPSLWKKSLPKIRDFNYLQEEQNPVFSILRSSFDRLGPTNQSLFMDVVLYSPSVKPLDLLEWLSLVYNQDPQEIETWLLRLKEKGLLEDVNRTSVRGISVHDLYIEFAKLESQGKLNESADFELRKWVYYENTAPTDLEMTPSHRCWPKLFRIGIEGSGEDGQQHLLYTLQDIDWQNCSNVVVLKLKGLQKLRGDLNLQGLKCLRSLELFDIGNLESLDGLQDLNHLTYFRWVNFDNTRTQMGQLPASLQVVRLSLWGFFLRPDAFSNCTNLWKLELRGCRVNHLDFSNCKSLRTAKLKSLETLEILSGLTAASTPKLQSLEVGYCDSLLEIPGLGDLVGLELLYLHSNLSLRKLPDMQKLTRLQVLEMWGLDIEDVPGLGCLLQLRELQYRRMPRRLKLANLSALKQLEAVDFSANDGLSSLEGVVENLFALRVLNVSGCGMLRRLPDLSGMRRLEELDLRGSGVEIGEEDVCMLGKLPLLHPVQIGGYKYMLVYYFFRLDVVRRKVLKRVRESHESAVWGPEWVEWTRWEEYDLGMLPIAVGQEFTAKGWDTQVLEQVQPCSPDPEGQRRYRK